jgi:hypothetical protein
MGPSIDEDLAQRVCSIQIKPFKVQNARFVRYNFLNHLKVFVAHKPSISVRGMIDSCATDQTSLVLLILGLTSARLQPQIKNDGSLT